MDPVSVIVSALVVGIVNGIQSASAHATWDGYLALKNLILKRYGQISIEQLEQAPNSKARQAVVAEDLRAAGADHDSDIIALAQSLLDLVSGVDTSATTHTYESAVPAADLLEKAQRQAGNQAIGDIVDSHINLVLDLRAKMALNDSDLLSKRAGQNRNIPEKTRNEISQLHNRIRAIINAVAERIEDRNYRTAEEAIETMQLSLADRQRARELARADKRVHVSFQSLKTTVEFFAALNQVIIDKIERADSVETETRLVLGNALLVYELTDFVIDYIERFGVEGMSEIRRIYQDTQQRVLDVRKQQQGLVKMLEDKSIEEAVRNQTLADINNREKSIQLLEKEWQTYIDAVDSLQGEVGKIQAKLPTLEVIRENARVQISLIQAVAMLQILKQNVGAMQATILTLENIRLVSLSPNRVRRLLGIL